MDTLIKAVERFISGDWGEENCSPDSSEKVVCIRGADIENVQGGIYDSIPNRYISSSSLANKKLKVGDIVIEKSGGSPTQSTGRTCYISEDLIKEKKDVVCSNFCAAFSIRETWDYKYIYYYIQNIYNQGNFFNFEGKTSGIRNLLLDTAFKSIPLPPIDKTIQTKLSGILERIDQKISLNTRMNAELEAMAKQLYDYWFVQFDFPDENGKPYKSSGGKMVWNEKLKREIPEGWELKNIFDVSDVLYGFPFRTDCFVTEITEKPVVRIRDIMDNTSSAYTTEDVDDIYRLKEGDLVVGMDGNFHMNYWHNNSSYLNQRCVRFRDIPEVALSTVHLFYSIKPILEHKQKSIKGSTVGHLLDSDIKDFWILCPSKKYRKEMKQNMDSILRIITKNKNEMIHLTHLRDSLLPMLMNGQVTIE